MKNISSRKNIMKDAAILLTLATLLVALPWTQELLRDEEEQASTERGPIPPQVEESEAAVPLPSDQIAREKQFISEVFPRISSWQVDRLEPYLADVTKSGDWTEEIGSVLGILAERLGQLQRHGEPERIPIADAPTDAEGDTLSEYEFVAYYTNGVADINLVLAAGAGQSSLHSFNISVHDQSQVL